MMLRQPGGSLLIWSGIFLSVGCSAHLGQSPQPPQLDHRLDYPSATLAGVYEDVGPDGSIKPHREVSHTRQEGHRTDGAIVLDAQPQVPDPQTGTIINRGKPERTMPPKDSTGFSRNTQER